MIQDSPWKDILEQFFPEFLEFFFPEIYRDIDFTKGFEILNKELNKILKSSEIGKRIVDKLVKVFLKDGNEKWLLIHIEIQGYPEKDFAKRIYIYNYRIFDRFEKEVISLCILTDTNPGFRPNEYRVSRWGFEYRFRFPIVKLIDYFDRWEELDNHPNPFVQAVRAYLKTLETEGNNQARYSWKKTFLLELYQRGFNRETILSLYRFIDWIMTLPEKLDDHIFEEITKLEEEKNMPYITTAERIGIRKGKREGKREGFLESIYEILNIKFGEEGLQIFNKIKHITDVEVLLNIHRELVKAQTLAAAETEIEQYLSESE